MSDEAISEAELAEWQALADAASVGPWHEGHRDIVPTDGIMYVAAEVGEYAVFTFASPDTRPNKRGQQIKLEEADAAFIAASRTAMPRLLAAHAASQTRILALEAENEKLIEELCLFRLEGDTFNNGAPMEVLDPMLGEMPLVRGLE